MNLKTPDSETGVPKNLWKSEYDYSIDTNIPGGNIIVDLMNEKEVLIRQDLRDTEGSWFYWAFRVRAKKGKNLTFTFPDNVTMGFLGPAVSTDDGESWHWLWTHEALVIDPGLKQSRSFSWNFENEKEVRFSVNIPYFQRNWEKFLEGFKSSRNLNVSVLTESIKKRNVELVHITCSNHKPRYRVILTSRHHACESMGTWVMEGFLKQVLGYNETGEWFRSNVDIVAVPFMDKDGVEDGDQGKNRRPHDHNRDYSLTGSIYPEVIALKNLAQQWSPDVPGLMLDLHCPYLKDAPNGGTNEFIYIVGKEPAEIWDEQNKFGMCIERANISELPYKKDDNLLWGIDWNNTPNSESRSSTTWFSQLPSIKLACGMEFPYASVKGVSVSAKEYIKFGASLADAARNYLLSSGITGMECLIP